MRERGTRESPATEDGASAFACSILATFFPDWALHFSWFSGHFCLYDKVISIPAVRNPKSSIPAVLVGKTDHISRISEEVSKAR